MAKAVWNGRVLAESHETVVVEGNHYFPEDSLNGQYFQKSKHHSLCLWKGVASYYTIEVGGQLNKDAAWFYPRPWPPARKLKGLVAFWRGVRVED
ncbi:MAG: DUF427 domain-containing protein [Actinomycetota bacterium]